jgi:predicted dehydrogenase
MSTRTTKKLRYAVVGAGNIAQVAVLPAFAHAENSELVALVSGDPAKREAVADRFAIEHSGDYAEFEAVVRRAAADAVYIALPNNQHREYTERAAALGVHVLCEKPMAPTEADCEAMIAACKQADVRLMIAYRLHFEAATLAAIDLVRQGKLGEPRIFSSVFTQQVRPGDIRTRKDVAGGAVFDLGVYPINAARHLFGCEPREVLAVVSSTGDARFDGVDEMTTAVLRFSDGQVAQFTVGFSAAATGSYRIVGTEGDLRVEPGFGYVDGLRHYLTIEGETREQKFPRGDQFAPELLHFSDCVLNHREPEPSGEEGLADVRIAVAILRSAASGKPVALAPFERSRRPGPELATHRPPVRQQEPIDAPSPSVR